MSCGRCGLTRGSEVTDSDKESWASAAGVPVPGGEAEKPGWQRWLRFWWIPAIGIALLVGWFTTAQRGDDGSLTSGGTVSVTDLRAGDCFNGAFAAALVFGFAGTTQTLLAVLGVDLPPQLLNSVPYVVTMTS